MGQFSSPTSTGSDADDQFTFLAVILSISTIFYYFPLQQYSLGNACSLDANSNLGA